MKNILSYKIFEEVSIDSSGDLKNFNPKLSSEDIISDESLNRIIDRYYEAGREIPRHIYQKLSNRHKHLYIKNILDSGGGVLITDSENEEFLITMQNIYYEELKKVSLEYMDMYSTFGNEYLPLGITFIKIISEELILDMLKRLSDKLEYPILILREEFNAMSDKCKLFILKHKYNEEDFNGDEDVIKNCFLIDLDM
jgi:hypothetical protein